MSNHPAMLHSLTILKSDKTSKRSMPTNSTPILIDSHVHTDDPRLLPDLSTVLGNARRQNVAAQVVPSISQQHWTRVKSLCAAHSDLFPCYGLHPCYYPEHTDAHLQELPLWLGREPVVAVGECGLDYATAGAQKAQQQQLFAAQLSMAREFNLPIVIHAVRAVEDVIRMIRASGHNRGMVHSYNGSLQQAKRLIDLGFMLSFGGAVTHSRAKRIQSMVAELPLDALLIETDAPDQPPAQYRQQRNEPAYLVDVWHAISELRTESAEDIAHATTSNARRLFALPEATFA